MANILIGKVAPLFRGEYDATTTYNRLDVVYYDGSSYVCVVDNTKGISVTNTSKWKLVAKKGGVSWSDFTEEEKLELSTIVWNMFQINSDETDLDIVDGDGNVICRFKNGNIYTQNFDSSENVDKNNIKDYIDVNVSIYDSDSDLSFSDEVGNVILDLKDGHIKTKNFDSNDPVIKLNEKEETDLDFTDEMGNVALRVKDGELYTKNFASDNLKLDEVKESDFAISDDNGNLILEIKDGDIFTKNFASNETSKDNGLLSKLKFLSNIESCSYSGNFMHISFDDVSTCLNSLFSGTHESIYEVQFFQDLKDLHEEFGVCFSLYVFVNYLNNATNKFKTELQEAKSWLKWNFHAWGEKRYNVSDIKADYDLFLSKIMLMCDNDADCLDHQFRASYWELNLSNGLYLKNHATHKTFIFCAKDPFSPSTGNYYLNDEQKRLVFNNGMYIDIENEIIFIQTAARIDSDDYTNQSKQYIKNNIKWQKHCEILNHEWGFNKTRMRNFLLWARDTMNFKFGFFDNIYKF